MPHNSSSNSLYGQAVAVTATYMGPAANRFLVRQIHAHLGKEPAQLEPKDMAVLANWIKIEISLLTEDDELIDTFVEALKKLGKT